eukprot:SAG11_NODE_35385_length_266_cov_13.389222_1_plen_22_part_01
MRSQRKASARHEGQEGQTVRGA